MVKADYMLAIRRYQGSRALAVLGNDFVHDAIIKGLLRRHDEIPLDVTLDLFKWLASMMRQEAVQHGSHPQNLPRLNINVGCLS